MSGNEHLTIGEFSRRMDAFEQTVTSHITRVETKVDGHHARIAVLEAADKRERRTINKKTVGWGAIIASGITLAVEAIKAFAK
jgi:hypothetical protein